MLQRLTTLEKTLPGGETAMAPLWHELAGHHLKRRGMVFILSDFFDQLDPLMTALQHLRHRHHEVVLLQVLAPEELDFPFKRLTQFRDLEARDQKRLVDTRRLRDDYLKNFERSGRPARTGRPAARGLPPAPDRPAGGPGPGHLPVPAAVDHVTCGVSLP